MCTGSQNLRVSAHESLALIWTKETVTKVLKLEVPSLAFSIEKKKFDETKPNQGLSSLTLGGGERENLGIRLIYILGIQGSCFGMHAYIFGIISLVCLMLC